VIDVGTALAIVFFLVAIGWWVHNRGFGLRPAPLRPTKRTFVALGVVLLPLVGMAALVILVRGA
jgi:hypothetical protein